ncbi:MAG TPA: PDZ domain-containing protein, partial [Isosphaeraceae bacterium]
MRRFRWPISTAIILATAAAAAAQETRKALVQQGGTPTAEYKVIGHQDAEKPDQPNVKQATVADDRVEAGRQALKARLSRIQEGEAVLREKAHAKLELNTDASVLSQLVKYRAAVSNDPHREVILRLRSVATESCTQCHAGGVSVKKDEALGLTLVPADETLRSQLKLEKTGLVVTEVAKGSPGEAGGIKEKDIVVALDDKPLADVESFKAALDKAASVKPP